MKTAKILVLVVLGLFAFGKGYAQSAGEIYPDRTDPVKTVQLYPNPATEFLTVKFEQPMAKRVKFAMTSILGNALEMEVETVDEHEVRIKVRDLPSGYYFLALQDEESHSKSTYKFLKR